MKPVAVAAYAVFFALVTALAVLMRRARRAVDLERADDVLAREIDSIEDRP